MQTYLELIDQIKDLNEKAEEQRKKEFNSVIADINEKIALYRIKEDDLKFPEINDIEQPSSENKTKTKLPPKYRNTETGEEWTGRGQPPKWITKADKYGINRDDFLINKPDITKSDSETNPSDVNNTVDEPHNEESNLN